MNYIRKHSAGVEVHRDESLQIVKQSLRKHLDALVIPTLSTVEGRKKAISAITGMKRNVPVYVNDECCLIPLIAEREWNALFINYFTVLEVEMTADNQCDVRFADGSVLTAPLSSKKVLNRLNRCTELLQCLQQRKLSENVF